MGFYEKLFTIAKWWTTKSNFKRYTLINDEDNYKTLLEKSYKECANILYDTLIEIKNGISKRIRQSNIHPIGLVFLRVSGAFLLLWIIQKVPFKRNG